MGGDYTDQGSPILVPLPSSGGPKPFLAWLVGRLTVKHADFCCLAVETATDFPSLALVREWASCSVEPAKPIVVAGIACAETPGCARGPIIACIHDRAHEVDPSWLDGGLAVIMQAAGFPNAGDRKVH